MTLIILEMMFISSMLFLFLNHPLSLGMILLIQTILTSIITGIMNYNFWFSYILFLIMIGGMLILFVYMTSIASNEKFKFSSKLFFLIMISSLSMTSIFLMMDQFMLNMIFLSSEYWPLNIKMNNYLSLNKYFNYPNNLILYTLIIYLLITLIMVVKITNIKYGPLRQKY